MKEQNSLTEGNEFASLDDIFYNKKEGGIRFAMKMYFVIADQFKRALSEKIGTEKPWDSILSISDVDFKKLYEEVYEWADKLTQNELDKWVYHPQPPVNGPDKSRLWRFDNAEWSIENTPLEQIGVWPRYCGVDHSITTGNVIETARNVELYLKSGEPDEKVTQKAIDKAQSMMQYTNLMRQLFPIVVIEAGENTRRAKENKNPEVIEKGLKYIKTRYDCEDGSSRIVSFALSGIKEVKCFVGKGLQETYPPESYKLPF